jgi:ATP-dependent RNA helicase DHX57
LLQDDLPTRFRPTASVADFVSSARAGSGSKTLVQTWLVEKLIKEIGFPRKAVEGVLRLSPGGEADDREWGEGEAVEALTRRMVGLEEGEWGVENVLERLRIGRGGMEVVVDVGMRDEKRREELEAVESVFDERYVPNPEKPEEHVTIAIPPLDPESATTDDLMIHILFPSDPISSPYPSATHPTSPPPFYLTSFSLPAYIRLHLQALVYRQFTDPDREDLRSTLESGEGGVVFAMVDFLSQEWEAIVENPPDVSQVTKYLVPKLPPPPKDATPTGPVGKKNAGRRGPSVRREPSREELESLKRRTEEWQARQEFEKVLKGRMGLPAWKSREEVLEALDRHRVLVVVGETGSGKTTQLPQFILGSYLLSPYLIWLNRPTAD